MTDDFGPDTDPPRGTLLAVARRHGTDIEGARRIMGLPARKAPFFEVPIRGTFQFNATVWLKTAPAVAVAIRDKYGPVRAAAGRQPAATFAGHIIVEPTTEEA